MKEIVIGDITIYSEDDDIWEDLIKIIRKVNPVYAERIRQAQKAEEKSFLKRILGIILRRSY